MVTCIEAALCALRDGDLVFITSTDYRTDFGIWKVCGSDVATGELLARSGTRFRSFWSRQHRFYIRTSEDYSTWTSEQLGQAPSLQPSRAL